MSNKILDTETMAQIWKELKMIDIFAYAHEKGREEGLETFLEIADGTTLIASSQNVGDIQIQGMGTLNL